MPAWSRDPFERFLDYVTNESRLLWLATRGIEMLDRREKLAEALYKVREILDTPKDEAEASLKEARETAKLARGEVKADFPLLHAHSLLGVWGALEALVQDVVLAWLTHRKALLTQSEFASVRVPVAEFQRMKVAERLEYLLEQFPSQPGRRGRPPAA